MHLARIAAVLIASAAGCALAHQKAADDTRPRPTPTENPSAETSQVGDERRGAHPLYRDSEDPAFRRFVASLGTTPDLNFAVLEQVNGEVRCVAASDGWRVWKERWPDVWVIAHDEGGFHTTISIAQIVSSPEQDAPAEVPDVSCTSYKGVVVFRERRAVRTHYGRIEIKLRVQHNSESGLPLEEMFAHVRKHYGKYQGVCQQVQELIDSK